MITKIGATTLGVIVAFPVLIAALMHAVFSALVGTEASPPSQDALADIPADYLALYRTAATVCPGLDWSILAAIGKIESDHGRSTLRGVTPGTENSAHARGPMQFLQPTFNSVTARHTIPPGGQTPPSPWNKHDAIYAASFYLCDSMPTRTSRTCPPHQSQVRDRKSSIAIGKAAYLCDNGARRGDLQAAIFAYNHADWYVHKVLTQATRYSQTTPNSSVACSSFQSTVQSAAGHFSGEPALTAVAFACAQLGKPYVWGGNGDPGFDCSGLTHAAYQAAGIGLPRTAQTQYDAGPLLPPGARLQSGDLVFFGIPGRIHHVGISLGGTLMVNAPTFGQPVQVADLRGFGDYAGASRPAATRAA